VRASTPGVTTTGTHRRERRTDGDDREPGSNDVLSCSINWGDGTAAQVVAVAGGVCATTHAYAASVTSATITVTASDDDGGAATATRALSFNRPPICSAVKAVPDELWPPDGDLKLVTLVGASDPDGGPVTYTITGVTQNEQLGGWDGHDNAWYERGHHNRPPDAVILHGPYLLLRAWRDPHGDGPRPSPEARQARRRLRLVRTSLGVTEEGPAVAPAPRSSRHRRSAVGGCNRGGAGRSFRG
jgi:hypothetical protein